MPEELANTAVNHGFAIAHDTTVNDAVQAE